MSNIEHQKRAILFSFEILNLGISNRPTPSRTLSVHLHYFPHPFKPSDCSYFTGTQEGSEGRESQSCCSCNTGSSLSTVSPSIRNHLQISKHYLMSHQKRQKGGPSYVRFIVRQEKEVKIWDNGTTFYPDTRRGKSSPLHLHRSP